MPRHSWARVVPLAIAVLAVAAALWLAWRRLGVAQPRDLPTAPAINAIPPDSAIRGPVVDERRVGEYLVRIVEDSASHERVLDVSRRGRRLFARRSTDFRIERAGRDLTGDGQPDLMVVEFTGGLHCCTRATILGVGREFRDYGTVDGADGDVQLEDVNRDGVAELKIGDFRFAYWRDLPFSETPVPEVVLRFSGRGYTVACDLMREPPPDEATLQEMARELGQGWRTGDPPADLWGAAVNMVYAGNPDHAWRLLDIAWPAGNPGKTDFVRELRARLADNPCWRPGLAPSTGD